jgi:ankyrin repeat protein
MCDLKGNGLIPRGPHELKRWSNGLIRRGLEIVVPGIHADHTESLAIQGSIFDAVKNEDLTKVRAIQAIDPTKANDRDADNDWRTPLHYAAEKGHIPIIEILLEYGSEIDAQTGEEIEYTAKNDKKHTWREPGKTPLLLACFNYHIEAAKLLIQRNAEVNLADSIDYTPLHAAVLRGNFELVEILLSLGAKVDVKAHCNCQSEEFGWESDLTPMHIAARNGRAKIIEALLSHGASIDQGDLYKRTPLMYAARMGNLNATKILLSHGAQVNIKSEEDYGQTLQSKIGWTALDFAIEGNHQDIVQLLRKYGAADDSGKAGRS